MYSNNISDNLGKTIIINFVQRTTMPPMTVPEPDS